MGQKGISILFIVMFSFGVIAQENLEDGDNLLQYRCKKGDTLMLVAFEIYGDYLKWRELKKLNASVIGENNDLSHLPVLQYRAPEDPYIKPLGNPYLIKRRDSLSLISKKVYGNWREWPKIHKNNPRQIKDPNLIFAGFTLYYPPIDQLALY